MDIDNINHKTEAWHTSKMYATPGQTGKLKNKLTVKMGDEADAAYNKLKKNSDGDTDLVQRMQFPIYSDAEKDMLMKKLTTLTKDKNLEKEELIKIFTEELSMAVSETELKKMYEEYNRLLKVHSHILTKESTDLNLKKQTVIENNLEQLEEKIIESIRDCDCGLNENQYGEGWMIKAQLYNIIKAAASLYHIVNEKEDFEDWIQYKVTLAEDYILTAQKFIEFRKAQEGSFYGDDKTHYTE